MPVPVSGDIVAVACVVESSLVLAAEWRDIMTRYIVPLVQRLVETHNNSPNPWACIHTIHSLLCSHLGF